MSDSLNSSFSYLDVSGVGNSGKSAVVDILKEFDIVYTPHYSFEFDFLRILNGVLDLRHHLLEDWSPVRSDAAVKSCLKISKKMGIDPKWYNFKGLVTSSGHRYDKKFMNQFILESKKFITSFIIDKYNAEWPYDNLTENSLKVIGRKILRRLGFRRYITRQVLLVDNTDFDTRLRQFLDNIYRMIVPENKYLIVLNNGIEPYNPVAGLDMLQGRQIVVTRDPRDVYVSGLNYHKAKGSDTDLLSSDNDGMNKSFLATDDLSLFVKRFKLYNQKIYQEKDSRVMKISFEDICLEYNQIINKIYDFLDLKPESHYLKKKFFDPALSSKNIGLWKKYTIKNEINYIEKELAEYLYEK